MGVTGNQSSNGIWSDGNKEGHPMAHQLEIGGRWVGEGQQAFVVAEIGIGTTTATWRSPSGSSTRPSSPVAMP